MSTAIDPLAYGLDLPGGLDEPGHRDLPATVNAPHVFGRDLANGVEEFFYNFRDDYGLDPFGNPLHNLITESQKQRARVKSSSITAGIWACSSSKRPISA